MLVAVGMMIVGVWEMVGDWVFNVVGFVVAVSWRNYGGGRLLWVVGDGKRLSAW